MQTRRKLDPATDVQSARPYEPGRVREATWTYEPEPVRPTRSWAKPPAGAVDVTAWADGPAVTPATIAWAGRPAGPSTWTGEPEPDAEAGDDWMDGPEPGPDAATWTDEARRFHDAVATDEPEPVPAPMPDPFAWMDEPAPVTDPREWTDESGHAQGEPTWTDESEHVIQAASTWSEEPAEPTTSGTARHHHPVLDPPAWMYTPGRIPDVPTAQLSVVATPPRHLR
jgi:hypothetical protein